MNTVSKKDKHGDRTNMAFVSNWPEYNIWRHIKYRCLNAASPAYADYGGRGIKMYEPWQNDFKAFIDHVGRRPSPKHTLDRKDNDKGYEPGNLHWTTRTVQAINRRVKNTNTSGVSGVGYHIRIKRWNASINSNGKRLSLGYFDTKDEAIKARKQAETKYYKSLMEN